MIRILSIDSFFYKFLIIIYCFNWCKYWFLVDGCCCCQVVTCGRCLVCCSHADVARQLSALSSSSVRMARRRPAFPLAFAAALLLLAALPPTLGQQPHTWDASCPEKCKCIWLSGSKGAECTARELTSIPLGFSPEIQVTNKSNQQLIYYLH